VKDGSAPFPGRPEVVQGQSWLTEPGSRCPRIPMVSGSRFFREPAPAPLPARLLCRDQIAGLLFSLVPAPGGWLLIPVPELWLLVSSAPGAGPANLQHLIRIAGLQFSLALAPEAGPARLMCRNRIPGSRLFLAASGFAVPGHSLLRNLMLRGIRLSGEPAAVPAWSPGFHSVPQ